MKIEKLILSNFRSYKEEIEINFNDLNVLVGKNDIGKSTILEALDVFFNENKGTIKLDKNDINKFAEKEEEGNTDIKIAIVFGDLPESITIDISNPTDLKSEYLLNRDNKLEIVKKYPNGGKEKIFVKAFHPNNPKVSDLLLKKNIDLKKLLTNEMNCLDKKKNSEIRKAIWTFHENELDLADLEIELSKLDSRNTWEQLKTYLPTFCLFQSDRKNSDGDDEIQNPMRIAVKEILNDDKIKKALQEVASTVETKLTEVAENTLEKLNEMNPEIAQSLKPIIPSATSLKWNDVFKSVTIAGEDDIPINKRGSGIKRLILLNFFRAEAEKRQKENRSQDIIYAIEEPETSQHPNHQKKLIEAFIQLAKTNNTQIILTTHSPAIVKLLEFKHIKLIKNTPNKAIVNVEKNELPYPSLNEINFLAFDEANEEYHNELYGYIESEGKLNDYNEGKEKHLYKRQKQNGNISERQYIMSEIIRHQIHHPENTLNDPYTYNSLMNSINEMREFISREEIVEQSIPSLN